MTRRSAIGGLAAAAATAPLTALIRPADGKARPQTVPTMQQLIALAEAPAQSDRRYYGQLLAMALAETGRIANDNGDNTITLYEAELIRDQGGVRSWGWTKNTVCCSLRPVPDNMLPHFRPANRGQFFPTNVRYQPLQLTCRPVHSI